MAIVKMKKLRVMAMADQRDELLKGLLHLGCVEISEPDDKLADPAWSALLKRGTSDLAKVRTDLADANTALEAIKRYAQTKDGMFTPRPEVTEEEFLDPDSSERAKELCTQVGGNLQDISRLQGEENRLLSREAALRPWMPLDMPLELEGTEHVLFRLGTCPGATDTGALRTALAASDAAVEVYEINSDKQQKYYLLICHRSDEDAVLEVSALSHFRALPERRPKMWTRWKSSLRRTGPRRNRPRRPLPRKPETWKHYGCMWTG